MESLNTIQVIHAADADQHLGHLKKILDELKSERRIENYSTLESDAVNESSLSTLRNGDMVITLLTEGISSIKVFIEETMLKAKGRLPKAKMAEIIIDHVPYENQFIAFPSDLQPIRSREDMDGVWNKIGQTLKDIFPVQEEPDPVVVPVPWKKYVPYVLGALALLSLFYLIPAIGGDDEMKVVGVGTSVTSLEIDSDDCPKQFDFEGTIEVNAQGKVVYTWLRSDGQPSAIDTLNFETAGKKQVTSSSWTLGSDGEKHDEWQQLKIISPNVMLSDKETIAFECKGTDPRPTDSGPTDSGPPVIPVMSDVTATAQVNGDAKISIDCGSRHRFSFSGTIKANGKGKVNYAWVGNDGNTSPLQTLDFEKAGSQTVSTTKTLAANSESGYEGWQQLKIVSPTESYSDVAKFYLVCKKKEVDYVSAVKLSSLSPTTGRTLNTGTKVNFKFAYATKWPNGVRIFGRPMFKGKVAANYAAHGASILTAQRGSAEGYFTLSKSGSVDQIRFQMWDSDQKKLLTQAFVPVNYRFVTSTTTSGVNAKFTNLGNSKTINSSYFRKQGIRSVKAKPSGSYCATAVPAILAKGTYRAPSSFLSTSTPSKLNSCNGVVLEFVFNSPVKTVTVYFYGAAVDYKLTAYSSNGTALGSRTKKAVAYNYTRPYSVTYKSTSKNISRISFGYQAALTKITAIQGN